MKKIIAISLLCMFLVGMTSPLAAASADTYILAQPQNYIYNEGAVAIYYVTVAGENLQCTWYLDYDGKTYNLSEPGATGPWVNYVTGECGSAEEQDNLGFTPSHTTFSYHFNGCEAGLDGSYIYAEIYDGQNTVTSSKALIQLSEGAKSPPMVYVPAAIEVCKGDAVELECSALPIYSGKLSYIWYETPDGDLTKIRAVDRGEQTSNTLVCDTSEYGVRYYVCGVAEEGGGSAYSSVIAVTVMESQLPPAETSNVSDEAETSDVSEVSETPEVSEISDEVQESETDLNTESSLSAENSENNTTQTNKTEEKTKNVWIYVSAALGVSIVGMTVVIAVLLKKKKA